MTHERSDRVWHAYQQSADRFDYFMAGLCTAITGYVAQNFHPAPLGWNAATVELVAILCLIGSVMAALKRIESIVTTMGVMHHRLYHGEAAGVLMDASQKPGMQLNTATGGLMDPVNAREEARSHRTQAKAAGAQADRWAATSRHSYRWRNRLLVLGFCLLVAARILAAYAR